MKRFVFFTLVLTFGILFGCRTTPPQLGTANAPLCEEHLGKTVPDFSFATQSGETHRFAQVRGDLNVVGFVGGSVDKPCTISTELIRLARQNRDYTQGARQYVVEFISVGEPCQEIGEFPIQEQALPDRNFLAICDRDLSILHAFKSSLGEVYLVDGKGVIVWWGRLSDIQGISDAIGNQLEQPDQDRKVRATGG